MDLINEFKGHPVSESLPLVSGLPWKLVLILTGSIYFIKSIGPQWMKSRQPYDLKPVLLIYNGILFGCNGAGLMLDLWVTDLASISFDCSPIQQNMTQLKPFFTVYLAYIFFWLHLSEMLPRISAILMKKDLRYDNLDIASDLLFLAMIYLGLKFYPGNASSFLPTTTLAFGLFDFAMRVCASAGPPVIKVDDWEKPFFIVKLLHFSALLVHGLMLCAVPSCRNIAFLPFCEILVAAVNLINTLRNGSEAWTKSKFLKID